MTMTDSRQVTPTDAGRMKARAVQLRAVIATSAALLVMSAILATQGGASVTTEDPSRLAIRSDRPVETARTPSTVLPGIVSDVAKPAPLARPPVAVTPAVRDAGPNDGDDGHEKVTKELREESQEDGDGKDDSLDDDSESDESSPTLEPRENERD